MEIKNIHINNIQPNPLQPRETFNREKLQELANSIQESELLEPIIVKKNNGTYEIVAGERRWKAFQILKKETIPAIIWDVQDDIEALEKGLIENLQRDDLTSTERENAVHKLWKSGKYKTKANLSRKLGISETEIFRLTDAKEFREKTFPGKDLPTKTIFSTRGLSDEDREKVLKQAQKNKMSSDKVEEYVRDVKKMPEPVKKAVLDEEIEYERVKPRLEVGIPDELANPLVEELKKEKTEEESLRKYHEETDKAVLTGDLKHKEITIKRPMEEQQVEKIKNVYRQVNALSIIHFEKITYPKYKEEAIHYLKKMQEHCKNILLALKETPT